MEPKEILGKFISKKRAQLQLTQEELAIKAGVSRANIIKIETEGKGANVTFNTLIKILDALESNLLELAEYYNSTKSSSSFSKLPKNILQQDDLEKIKEALNELI